MNKENLCNKSITERSKIVLKENHDNLIGKRVAIIGLGGTGSLVAELLARMHVLKLILVDFDIVEPTNLERQILYSNKDIGKKKAAVAKARLKEFCDVIAIGKILGEKMLDSRNNPLKDAGLIIDCTDNNEARFVINRHCIKNNIPWIYTGAIGKIGAVYFIRPKGPCFECFSKEKSGEKCSTAGVLNSTVSLIASLAVSIAVDYLAAGKVENEMIRVNLGPNTFSKISIAKNKSCSACR